MNDLEQVAAAAIRWRRACRALAAHASQETVDAWCTAVTDLERAVDALTDRPGRIPTATEG